MVADLFDVVNCSACRSLNGRDLALDVLGCSCSLLGQLLDLIGDHGNPLAGLTAAYCLDGCVEREQVGLRGNAGNGFCHFADILRGPPKLLHHGCDGLGLAIRIAADTTGLFGVRRNFSDSRAHSLRGSYDGCQIGRSVRHGLRH